MRERVAARRTPSSRPAPTKFLADKVPDSPLTPRGTAEIIATCLREIIGEDGHAAKRLARAANSTKESAENWLSGRNAPNLAAFLNMCRQYPQLRAEADRLMAMEAEIDPEFQRALAAFTQAYYARTP
jgi:hypothetical protein